MKQIINEANVHDIYWNRPTGGVIVEEVSPDNYQLPKMFNESSLLTAIASGRSFVCITHDEVKVYQKGLE